MAFRNPVKRISRLSDLIADTVTGALVRTAAAGARVELGAYAPTAGLSGAMLQLWCGLTGETPAHLQALSATSPLNGARGNVQLSSADTGAGAANLIMFGASADGGLKPFAQLDCELDLLALLIGSGRRIAGLDYAAHAGVTDANGNTQATHGLNLVPVVIVPVGTNAGYPYQPAVIAANSTIGTFDMKWRHNTTGAVAPQGTGVNCQWVALA